MANFAALENIALTFPEVTIDPHFERLSFRVKRKIFATYDERHNTATVKLSDANQAAFSLENQSIYPVSNKWGKQGWTIIELRALNRDVLAKILISAYCEVAPKKLSKQVKGMG